MEYMNINAHLSGINFDVYVIYGYPGSSVISFCEELTDILENNITKNKGHLLLLGDFNIHLDNQDIPDAITFQDFMDSFGLINHTKQSTHTSSHILDLVISQPEFSPIVKAVELGHFLSDHCFTHMSLLIDRPIPPRKHIKYWKLKSFDQSQFSLDLFEAFNIDPKSHVDWVEQYNTELRNVLDKHTPEKSKYIRNTHQQPCFNEHIKSVVVFKGKKERIWKIEQTPYAWNAFYQQHQHVVNIIKEVQCNHFEQIIQEP